MRSLCLLILSLSIAPFAWAETRVFVSLAGTLLEAEITAVSGDSVTLKRASDDQSITISRTTLCKEDNAYISRWQERSAAPPAAPAPVPAPGPAAATTPAQSAQKYRLTCQTLPAKSTRGTSTGSMHTIELTYNFTFSNQEVKRDLESARGTAITLGRELGAASGDLIVLQKVDFDVNIRAQSKMAYATPPMRLSYSQDPDSQYGVKNYGYVLIIRDAAGAILLVEASPDTSARYVKEILALDKVPCVVTREFQPQSRGQVPLGYISF